MSASSTFYKAVHQTGQGFKTIGRGIGTAWDIALGNTILKENGLSLKTLQGTDKGMLETMTVSLSWLGWLSKAAVASNGHPREGLALFAGMTLAVPLLMNMASLYQAGKANVYRAEWAKQEGQEKARKARATRPKSFDP